jgi:hydrogenase maturation protease
VKTPAAFGPSAKERWLVVGYGNELRRDDAVGPRIAGQAAAWRLPGVTALALHQLTPELAAALAKVEAAVFVDASVAETAVAVRELAWLETDFDAAHSLKPAALLALTGRLFPGQAPRAWLLTVPARSLDLGEGLSPETETCMAEALLQLKKMLEPNAA